MASGPRALIVYYSFTHQTERAATRLEQTFIDEGWETRTCRLDYADGPPDFPLRPFWKRSLALGLPSLRERPVPVRFDESVLAEEWDLVVIGSPTWVFSPAQPVSSFLKTPAATHLLSGRPFGAFVVCRGFWRRNLARIRHLGHQAGGRFVAGAGFGFDGNYLQTNHSFFAYHLSGGDANAALWGRLPTPYGLSEVKLERLGDFGRRLVQVSGNDSVDFPTGNL